MADDIVIDKAVFHDRLSNFVAKWKADKRGNNAIFQGADSIATVVGKASDPGSYLKPAAFQVHLDPWASKQHLWNRLANHLRSYGY